MIEALGFSWRRVLEAERVNNVLTSSGTPFHVSWKDTLVVCWQCQGPSNPCMESLIHAPWAGSLAVELVTHPNPMTRVSNDPEM